MDFHDLAYRACILRPSLTGILTRMERDGLVLRLKPINDQRKLYISLTKEGQALYNRAQTQIEEAYRQIEAQFTAEIRTVNPSVRGIYCSGQFPTDIPGDNQ